MKNMKEHGMNHNSTTIFAMIALAIAVIILFTWSNSLRRDAEQTTKKLAGLQDSLTVLHLVVDSLKAQTPGLGEHMSTMQLHTAKLWFAGQSSNWRLVKYELDELEETIEAAEALHAKKNNVDISAVLQSMRESQLPLFEKALDKKSPGAFKNAYSQTLAACNGCHQASGYEFIHIITPTREPVTNQRWQVGGP